MRTGKPASWASLKGEKDRATAMEAPTFAEQFAAAMHCRGAFLGPALARGFDFGPRARLLEKRIS
ncbi:MAG: hypothetical protein HY721_26080 [Planctomycetes bacterium]|nr:hypothetical protein [Planctomycetota bacterium]